MVAAPPEGLIDANDEKEEGEEDEGTVQESGGDNMDTT